SPYEILRSTSAWRWPPPENVTNDRDDLLASTAGSHKRRVLWMIEQVRRPHFMVPQAAVRCSEIVYRGQLNPLMGIIKIAYCEPLANEIIVEGDFVTDRVIEIAKYPWQEVKSLTVEEAQ